MPMRVARRMTSYRFDGTNDEEIMAALHEECVLVSTNAQQLTFTGMDSQMYIVPVTGYIVIDHSGWPASRGLTVQQYEAQFSEISSV